MIFLAHTHTNILPMLVVMIEIGPRNDGSLAAVHDLYARTDKATNTRPACGEAPRQRLAVQHLHVLDLDLELVTDDDE